MTRLSGVNANIHVLASSWGCGTGPGSRASRQKGLASALIIWLEARARWKKTLVADETADRQLTAVFSRSSRGRRSDPARRMAPQRPGVLAPPDFMVIDVPGARNLSHGAPSGVTRFEQRLRVTEDWCTGIAVDTE